ncbi:MAG TPA: SulP family inorganic anion transporter [Steroidobacteraceae bacterium]|nr:SulP family inorganic anion transporter [Steroidobacteraceae bacterium]
MKALLQREPEPFEPKLVTVLREGYRAEQLRHDLFAALTVAIVALPLSMAIAIASGVGPERGLFAAIIGGFLVSALSGSRFQIGGPAGAFIVLVSAAVAAHGVAGVLLATAMAGVIMALAGLLRVGVYVRLIPHPVVLGFTAGIAATIFASQLHDLFGLRLGSEPAAFLPKLAALWRVGGTFSPGAVLIAACSIAAILLLKRHAPKAPGLLLAVAGAAVVAWLLHLPVETIGTRFGGVPRSLPAPGLPALSWQRLLEMLPTALSFALLGAIESLLSAVVADGMTGRRHRSNSELFAQGLANVGSALFGGLCVTGTIARTATNVRAGARTPVSGMLHSVLLLVTLLIAAPLVAYIPLAALAAVLVTVAWNMVERPAIARLLRESRAGVAVLLATLAVTLLRDLMWGILAGIVLAVILRRVRT